MKNIILMICSIVGKILKKEIIKRANIFIYILKYLYKKNNEMSFKEYVI